MFRLVPSILCCHAQCTRAECSVAVIAALLPQASVVSGMFEFPLFKTMLHAALRNELFRTGCVS